MNATRRRPVWTLVVSLVAASVAAVAAPAEPARAQAPVATLDGETLLACQAGMAGIFSVGCVPSGTVQIRARCTSLGTGTISWTATGAATGPYPGTFTETGAAQVSAGVLTTLAVDFSIESPLGDRLVEGQKFIPPMTPFSSTCTGSLAGSQFGVNARVGYTATITPLAGGSYDDEGEVNLDVFGISAQNAMVADVTTTIGLVQEFFESDLGPFFPPRCPDDDDEDNDGLTDRNERIFTTLLGNRDSDRDGIVDGNDDANGNGEDDEDEDDDDECPDDDSDGDGDDDEDEDDEDDEDDDDD